jgi:hypothetical protein
MKYFIIDVNMPGSQDVRDAQESQDAILFCQEDVVAIDISGTHSLCFLTQRRCANARILYEMPQEERDEEP